MNVKTSTDPKTVRALRAVMGMVNKQIEILPFSDGTWIVVSTMSGKPREYMVGHVRSDPDGWRCTCPDYQKRGQDCKHIIAVRLVVEQRI